MNDVNRQKVKLPSAAIIFTIASLFGLMHLFFRPIYYHVLIIYNGFILISAIALCVSLYKKNLKNVSTAAIFVLVIELIGHPMESLFEVSMMDMGVVFRNIRVSSSTVSIMRYIFAGSSVIFCSLFIVAILMIRKARGQQKILKTILYLGLVCCIGYSFFEFFIKGIPLIRNLFLVLWHIGNHIGVLLTIFWLNNPYKSPENIDLPKGKDKIEELKKLKVLLDNGAITQEEFDAKKKQILGL